MFGHIVNPCLQLALAGSQYLSAPQLVTCTEERPSPAHVRRLLPAQKVALGAQSWSLQAPSTQVCVAEHAGVQPSPPSAPASPPAPPSLGAPTSPAAPPSPEPSR